MTTATTTTEPTIDLEPADMRARRGAAWLDEVYAPWWGALRSEVDQRWPLTCVLAQVVHRLRPRDANYGYYTVVHEPLSLHASPTAEALDWLRETFGLSGQLPQNRAVELGFTLPPELADRLERWDELTDAWRAEIDRRRSRADA